MRARLVFLIATSLGLAGGAAFMTQSWLQSERQQPQAKQAPRQVAPESLTTKVLVAADHLPAGAILKPENLRWQAWPEDGVNEKYIVKKPDASPDIEGAVVRQSLASGEPLTERRVARPGDRGFLAAMLKPGHRAITVPINASTGLSGLIYPGDRVDVILTHTIDKDQSATGTARRASETVLSDIRVLALDQRTDGADQERQVAETATLELTPKEAERISLGQQLGTLSLSLRPIAREMKETTDTGSYTVDNQVSAIVTVPRQRSAGPALAPTPTVQVVRGGDTSETKVSGE